MKLLVKIGPPTGQAAHIVDAAGLQLCRVKIKRSTWKLQERPPTEILICYHCKRILARAGASLMKFDEQVR
jgi:hypothetical protein